MVSPLAGLLDHGVDVTRVPVSNQVSHVVVVVGHLGERSAMSVFYKIIIFLLFMIVENYVIYFMIKMYSTVWTSVNVLWRVSLVLEAFLRLGIFHPFPPECAGKFALQLRHRWSNVGVTAQACWLV